MEMTGTSGEIGGGIAGEPHYFIPRPSNWPMVGMISMALTMSGAALVVNRTAVGYLPLGLGFAALAYMMAGWFGDVIGESEAGTYNRKVDGSFRFGMAWFILSEVMFFASFFGALFYTRVISMPMLGDFDHKLLWPDYSPDWPNTGPAGTIEPFTKIDPWPIPTINTALLVSSAVWLTFAHHGLRADRRLKAMFWLAMTLLFGASFVGLQAYEYGHAYRELNLTLGSGIFGSTFFMLTGFHGLHVTIGAIMLAVILARIVRGHFRPDHHFAFEAAAWYWHFVDVVWIGLYIVVYWL
jgi:cytochrome c oxidase subunit 3